MENYLDKFILYLEGERNLSPYTVRNYRTDLIPYFDFLEDNDIYDLGDVDRNVLRKYVAWLTTERSIRVTNSLVKHGHDMRSVSRKISVLRTFYRFLVREGWLETNPVARLRLPKLDKKFPKFLSPQEASALVEAPLDPTPLGLRDRALLELIYATGPRVSEVVSLDTDDVADGNRELRVLGKGSKERDVVVGRQALDAIARYLSHGRPQAFRTTPRTEPSSSTTVAAGSPSEASRLLSASTLWRGVSSSLPIPTRSATASPPTCWTAAQTSGSFRGFSATRALARPRSTPT